MFPGQHGHVDRGGKRGHQADEDQPPLGLGAADRPAHAGGKLPRAEIPDVYVDNDRWQREEKRGQKIWPKPHRGDAEQIITDSEGHQRRQAQQRDHPSTALADSLIDRRELWIMRHPSADDPSRRMPGDEERGRSRDACGRGYRDDTDRKSEDGPGSKGEQGRRQDDQGGNDVRNAEDHRTPEAPLLHPMLKGQECPARWKRL